MTLTRPTMNVMDDIHTNMLHKALELAKTAACNDEVPVGAVLYTPEGEIIAQAHNEVETRGNASSHAELICLERAAQAGYGPNLNGLCLVTTLEPCAMCAQALAWAKVSEIRFGAYDVKSGGTKHGAQIFEYSHHKPKVVEGGILKETCGGLLTDFFVAKRKLKANVDS